MRIILFLALLPHISKQRTVNMLLVFSTLQPHLLRGNGSGRVNHLNDKPKWRNTPSQFSGTVGIGLNFESLSLLSVDVNPPWSMPGAGGLRIDPLWIQMGPYPLWRCFIISMPKSSQPTTDGSTGACTGTDRAPPRSYCAPAENHLAALWALEAWSPWSH